MFSKGLVAFKRCSAFPCFSLPFCPWCPGMDTWDLEEGKATSALFISFRYHFLQWMFHPWNLYICDKIQETPSLKPTFSCCLPDQHEYPRLFVPRTLTRTAIFHSGNWLCCNSHCVLHLPWDVGPPLFKSTRNLREILAFFNYQLENNLEHPSGTIHGVSCLYKPLSLHNATGTSFFWQ